MRNSTCTNSPNRHLVSVRSALSRVRHSLPLLPTAIAFLAGIGIGALRSDSDLHWLVLSGTVFYCVSVLTVPQGLWYKLEWALPFLLGVLAAPEIHPTLPYLPSGPLQIEGTITGPPRPRLNPLTGEITTRCRLKDLSISGRPVGGQINCSLKRDLPLGRGDRIRGSGTFSSSGNFTVAHPSLFKIIETHSIGGFDRWRRKLRQKWQRSLHPSVSPWCSALLLGDRGFLPSDVSRGFRRAGQGHLLAISGLHVGLLMSIVYWLTQRTPWRRHWSLKLIGAIALLGYAGLAGADPPVLRASIFGTIVALGISRGARPRVPELLTISVLLLTALTNSVSSISFWLSSSAVAGIAIVQGKSRDDYLESTPQRRVLQGLRIAIGAWLGAHVVLVWLTPEITPIGPLVSLILSPWLAGVLLGALLTLLPGFASVLSPVLEVWISLGVNIVEAVDLLPATPLTLPPAPCVFWSSAFFCFLLIAAEKRIPVRMITLVAILAVTMQELKQAPALIAPNLYRGQSVILSGDRATIVLDAGSIDLPEGGAGVIAKSLWRAGKQRIDALLLSHPHADHVLAVPGLLERISIGMVFVGPRFTDQPLGKAILQSIERANIPITRVASGDSIGIGEFLISVLHPTLRIPHGARVDTNDDSLVLFIEGAGFELIAPGDLETPGMAAFDPPVVRWCLLPHHGKYTPGLATWIDRIQPEGVISVGGLPDSRVRRLLAEREIRIYSTKNQTVLQLRPDEL